MILELEDDGFEESPLVWKTMGLGLWFFPQELDVNETGLKPDWCFAKQQYRVDE